MIEIRSLALTSLWDPPTGHYRTLQIQIYRIQNVTSVAHISTSRPLSAARPRDLLRPVSRDVSRRRKRVLKKIAARLRHQNFATEKESDEEAHSAKEFFRIRVRRKLGAMGFQRDEKRRGGGATGGRAWD
ncbi:hypothetical protein R1flu_010569 [Riccia fluitans]|uniref:Ribosomal protein S14 n=1 Tax=Riccia fluitans TaxID=41844 RepID=A0ABD1Z8E0_9MARC